jgi:hypothetical protein
MSSELQIVAPQSITETKDLAATLAKSALLPADLKNKEADILYTIMTGAELGLAPMQSIRGIAIIKGKPTLYADTMSALVKRRRDVCEYMVVKELTISKCTIETKRVGDPVAQTFTYAIEDAQRSGLAAQDNYKKYGPDMLRARCTSRTCRAVYSDLVLGLYDPEELRESDLGEERVEREVDAPPPPPTASRTESVLQKLRGKSAAPNVVEGEIVKPPPPPVQPGGTSDQKTNEAPKTETVWDRLKAFAAGHEISVEKLQEVTKKALQKDKVNPAEFTEADFKLIADALEAAAKDLAKKTEGAGF